MRRSVQLSHILAVFVALAVAGFLPHPEGALAQPTTYPRIQQSDLIYQGAFRLPSGKFGSSSFSYGGTALAYNPTHDSLFIVGHDWDQLVAEVHIPPIVNSAQWSDLATASVLQGFTDASEGKMATVDVGSIKVGGLMVHGGKLYGTAYSYYDADASQKLSHYRASPDFAVQGEVQGIYQVGSQGAGFVSGYMAAIPSEWQSLLGGPALTGQCCLAIIGRTSSGPAVFVFNPHDLGINNPVPAIPLVYYPLSKPLGDWGSTNPYYNGSTEIKGLVFPQGTRSILFFGRHGIGAFCYGPGTNDPHQAGKPADGGVDRYCYDPEDGPKGTHSYPYAYQVWAYDALELLKVKNGEIQPWSVRPYAVWNLNFPIARGTRIGGAAYDSQTQRIFLSQQCAEGDCLPVMHVFTVTVMDRSSLSSPTNLRVVQ